MSKELDRELLSKHLEAGTVGRQSHPELPLTILNYTPRCQYERTWDDVTLQCRGLVMHGDEIIARPFRKFFNDTEHPEGEIPWHLPSQITEKLDGSLLIAFYFDGDWRFCTRGSFTSPQSKRGEQIFRSRYSTDLLAQRYTYLFEVIYPENRIVVDYGSREDCVLLAVVNPQSGTELGLDDVAADLTKVRRLSADADVKQLRSIIRDTEEGYVVRFDNGFRVKVKGQRYMELHRLITGISSRSIWESLSQQRPFDEVLEVLPDEFAEWAKQERASQIAAFDALNAKTESAYVAVKQLPDRKSQAVKIMADFRDVSSAAFAALDGKPTWSILWKQLYPEFRRPQAMSRIEA